MLYTMKLYPWNYTQLGRLLNLLTSKTLTMILLESSVASLTLYQFSLYLSSVFVKV